MHEIYSRSFSTAQIQSNRDELTMVEIERERRRHGRETIMRWCRMQQCGRVWKSFFPLLICRFSFVCHCAVCFSTLAHHSILSIHLRLFSHARIWNFKLLLPSPPPPSAQWRRQTTRCWISLSLKRTKLFGAETITRRPCSNETRYAIRFDPEKRPKPRFFFHSSGSVVTLYVQNTTC